MFKFNIPLSIVLFSGSLTLLAIGSLLLVSNTAYSSHVQVDEKSINQPLPEIIQSASIKTTNTDELATSSDAIIAPPPSTSESLAGDVSNTNTGEQSQTTPTRTIEDSRRRSGRLYGGSGQSNYGNQQANSLDSYAAAYAAVNSPTSQDQSAAGLVSQSNVQANDASTFTSFGEPPPSVSGAGVGSANSSPGSTASIRQIQSSEYAPHSSYYAGYSAPSYNSVSYSNQDLGAILGGSSNNNNNNYHHSSPAQHHYGANSGHHYHKSAGSASLPLGYPTNYDSVTARYSPFPSSYYDRHSPYMSAAAASPPHWASGISGHSMGTGFMSTATNALSHWTGGFGLSEIICSIVAIAIGAIILGAPFFLIYLALMGNFSGSGTLSLTNPTSGSLVSPAATTTTVNGRRKRLAIFEQLSSSLNEHQRLYPNELGSFADSVVNHLSPFVDMHQVTNTFKRLVDSIEKYAYLKPEESKKRKDKTSA